MSQPSVSNQVRRLETSLQAVLVDRSGGRIRPTVEGEVLFEYGQRIFRLTDEAIAAVGQVSALETGRLSVGGTTTVATYLLPDLLARFRRVHPAVECEIVGGNAEQVTAHLINGEVGIALFAGTPDAAQLVTAAVLTDRLVLVADPAHRLAGRRVVPQALEPERFIVREAGSGTRRLQHDTLSRWGLDPSRQVAMWGLETIKRAVTAGHGLALISEHAVQAELAAGTLAVIDVDPAAPRRPVVIAHRKNRLLSAMECEFIRLLRSVPDWPRSSDDGR